MIHLLWLTIPLAWFGVVSTIVVLRMVLKAPYARTTELVAQLLAAFLFTIAGVTGVGASLTIMGGF